MYNKFVLKNGIRVVTENIKHVKSVSVGVWVETGSRHENRNNNGVSHFIEHLLFKGTKNRTAKEIAETIDSIGGQLNAFTSKECTCFYAKVLDNHLKTAIDVLSDMLLNSKFDKNDIEKEKSVILEEINMYEDSPEELVHDLLSQTIFNSHSLAFPILGKSGILKKLSRKDILDYFYKYYIPDNIVISVVGNINVKETHNLLNEYFSNLNGNNVNFESNKPPTLYQRLKYRNKSTEQLHLCLGMEGIAQGKDELYSLLVMNNIFGGSMSSRLFQKVREEKGLAYSIYSYPSSYKDIGIFTIYVGLNPKQLHLVSELIINEINTIRNEVSNEEEIYKAKEQLKGNFILGLENTTSRMTALGKSELLLGKIETQQEIIEKINKVKPNDINNIIENVFNKNKFNISYVGNVDDENVFNEKLKNIFFNKGY